MKNKLLISCVIIVLGILAFGTISASAATEGIYTYYVSGGEATITDCSRSAGGDITIPSTLGGYPVTSIGYEAFDSCTSLTSVTIPDSVTSIGNRAFHHCTSLTSITIGSSVTSVGDYAFYGCTSLTSIMIPDSVTSIGNSAFSGCESLTSVTISDSVTSIGNSAFSGCESLTSVTIGNGVTSIGDYAFSHCTSLTSITIPDSVTSIGYYAFSGCESLTSITIPDSVTSIGDYAFSRCIRLTSVTIPDSVKRINNYAFYYCTRLTSVTIPDGVKSIGNYAFSECTSLTSITIPDSVTSIGVYAFYYCTSLTSVTIPDSVTSIGVYAFRDCTSLTSVTIPDSVTSIGEYAFYNCKSLTSVTIGNSVTSIGNSAFSGCESLTSVTIGNSVTSIGYSAFSYCESLTSITIPDSVTSIGDYAFSRCIRLTSVTIPDGVTSIGNYAFYNCRSLTSVTIGNSVTSIGDFAFNDCTSLESITIPDSVTSIGDEAFYGCTSLESINVDENNKYFSSDERGVLFNKDKTTLVQYPIGKSTTSYSIPDSVTRIGVNAFYNCTSLTSIAIPDSVTSIGNYAFHYCTSLASVNITDIDAWCNISFSDSYSNPMRYAERLYLNGELVTDLVIPEGVTSIGEYAFFDCTSLTSVTIPDSVTSIGDDAFYGCHSLTSVTIPDCVTSIGDEAFCDCTSLESVTIPDSVKSIGKWAFYKCTKLKTVYYSGTADKWNKISIGSYNSSLTFANRIYVVNVKIVYENGKEVSFAHVPGNAIDTSYIPQKQHYTTVLYKDESRTEKISVDTPISESTTLYLGYESILYTHIFRDENGAVIKTESVPYGTVITPPVAPEKEATDDFSYTFAGWKDFTSGMTQTDVELVFVAQYDAVRNNLEQFKMVCDDSVEIGANIDLTASFATNISAQYIYITVGIPDGFAVRELTPIDFAEISLDSEEHKNGYTYFTYLGIYDYNGAEIPKNAKVLPFKMEIGVSKDVIAGEYPIIVSEAALINNEGSFIPFENMRGVTITVEPKLAESITIIGPSSIDRPTSFSAVIYPEHTSDKRVLWSVDDETVASIDENGLLTPLKNGIVVVCASSIDGSGCADHKTISVTKYAEILTLSSDVGMWDKAFSPDVYEYTIAVFGDVSSITLTPTFKGGVLRPNGTGLWISGTKKSFALGEDTTTITLVRQNVTDNADSTYTINVVKAKSEFYGAQIRTDDPQGLRFIFSIPRAIYDMLEHPKSPDDKGIGFGSVVMPKKYLGDNELTKETAVTINNKVYKSKIAPAVNLFEITDDEVKFTVCVIEISEKNFEEEYVAVPYITYIENGEEITAYGEKSHGITVFAIAEMAYADSKTSDSDKEYLYNNILSVVDPQKYPTNK